MPEKEPLFKKEEVPSEPVEVPEESFTHYVHLADGRVLHVNHEGHPDNHPRVHREGTKRTQVIGVYPRLDDEEE